MHLYNTGVPSEIDRFLFLKAWFRQYGKQLLKENFSYIETCIIDKIKMSEKYLIIRSLYIHKVVSVLVDSL